jgi:hypothetical protein
MVSQRLKKHASELVYLQKARPCIRLENPVEATTIVQNFVLLLVEHVVGKNLIFGHKHHIGIPYCG